MKIGSKRYHFLANLYDFLTISIEGVEIFLFEAQYILVKVLCFPLNMHTNSSGIFTNLVFLPTDIFTK